METTTRRVAARLAELDAGRLDLAGAFARVKADRDRLEAVLERIAEGAATDPAGVARRVLDEGSVAS